MYEETSKIIKFIKSLDDKGIEVFIETAKNEGIKFDADSLRLVLNDIRNS